MTQYFISTLLALVISSILSFFIYKILRKKNSQLSTQTDNYQKNIDLERQLGVVNERIANREEQLLKQNQENEKLQEKLRIASQEVSDCEYKNHEINIQKNILEKNFYEIKINFDAQKNEISELNLKLQSLEKSNGEFSFKNKNLEEYLVNLKNEINQAQQNSLQQFENLANKILDEKSQKFVEFNASKMNIILQPLGQNIEEFKKQVIEVYDKEARERFSLERVIKELQENSDKISQQANNLTNALKGSAKKQGNWGEMILESILQESGLIKDIHYFREKSFVNEDGQNLRPDFQILLPDNRLIIIDSKVSLIAYEKFCAIDNQQQQKTFIDDHLKSVYSHIDGLSSKKYDDLQKTLDFTMMFIPVEPSYLLAIQSDRELWHYAYKKRIVMVSSTNLIVCLKLINDLWKRELQSRNATEIVNRAEKLYEKIVGFVENFSRIGSQISNLQKSYDYALNQLSQGKGNLISQSKKLIDLGLKSDKKLPEILINLQDDIDENINDDKVDDQIIN
jgi:DNA recombination protein RmuC